MVASQPAPLPCVLAAPTPSVTQLPTPAIAAPEIVSFSVSDQRVLGQYRYWPEMTMRAGSSEIVITGVTLLDIGAHGRVPTHPGGWRIAAGSSRDIFHEVAYGEPAFYISGSQVSGRFEVIISYVDDAGRAADVSAIATVQPLSTPF